MGVIASGIAFRAALGAGIIATSLLLLLGTVHADDKTLRDEDHARRRSTTRRTRLPRISPPRSSAIPAAASGAEVYPASQLGTIPRQIEGVQFGAIQAAVIPPEFFVGVDERFEVMAAPGLVDSLAHGQRIAADPAVLKLMLGLRRRQGTAWRRHVHRASRISIVSKTPIRHLADFQGKKIRIFASDFQSAAFKRLGATPVAMTLGDVMPALQQGAIDGAVAGMTVFAAFHYQDAAKYVTETNQPSIFLMLEISKKWYESLPPDLQQIIDKDAAAETVAINPQAIDLFNKARQAWTSGGGELNSLPPRRAGGDAEDALQRRRGRVEGEAGAPRCL